MFVTSQGTAHGRFTRAIKMRNVRNAEDAARELGQLALEEAEPSLETVAAMSARLVERLTEPELSQL